MKFDITQIYHKKRPLSWSALSLFEKNPQMWFEKYVTGEQPIENREMRFGKLIDERIQREKDFIPELVRYDILQHGMRTTMDGIPLIGYADTYKPPADKKGGLRDYKTGRIAWTQARADETGQLTMYLLMLYFMDKVTPDKVECFIDWIPTHIENNEIALVLPVKVHTFQTKRTLQDVLVFGRRIKEAWAGMQAYGEKTSQFASESLVDW